MKKLYPYNQLSTKICEDKNCTQPLKQRIVEEKPSAKLCYKHYKLEEAKRLHFIDQNPRRSRVEAGLPTKYQ